MFRVKNWKEFQHYKDRNPPWIKLHKTLLDNFEWHRLQHASRSLAICIWIVASEYKDPDAGLVDDDLEKLAFRARMPVKEVLEAIKDLIKHGFIEHERDASDLLAPCYQLAVPETETETEKNPLTRAREKVDLENLSLDHIDDWLTTQRTNGRFHHIDEVALLEMFKDYCRSKGKKYKDYVAAFRNSFNWHNAPTKGNSHENHRFSSNGSSKSDRAKQAIQRGLDAFPNPPASHPDEAGPPG